MISQLREWHSFITAQGHILSVAPQLLLQQAHNAGGDDAPGSAARRRAEAGVDTRPWLRRVNLQTARSACLATLVGHTSAVNLSIEFTSDGTRVVSGSYDGDLRLWNARTGELLRSLSLGSDMKLGGISPRGAILAVSYGHRWWADTKVLDLDTGTVLHTIYERPEPPPEPVSLRSLPTIYLGIGPPEGEDYWQHTFSAFTPDGGLLVVFGHWYRSKEAQLRFFDTKRWDEIADVGGLPLGDMILSPDGRWLALTTSDSIRVLAVADRSEVISPRDLPKTGLARERTNIVFSPDGRRLAAIVAGERMVSKGGYVKSETCVTVREWDTSTGESVDHGITSEGEFESVSTAPDLSTVGFGCSKGLRLWDVATGKVEDLGKQGSPVYGLLFSRDGRQLAFACGNSLRLYSRDDRTLTTLGHHSSHIARMAFSPDGGKIVSGSGELRIWDTTVRETETPVMHNGAISSCEFSPDGRQIATASEDGSLKRWTGRGRLVGSHEHGLPVKWVAFSPDGTRILTRSEMRVLTLWDSETGAEVGRMRPHCYRVLTCAFSPDGRRIISGSGLYGQSELWMWDSRDGRFLRAFSGHVSWIIRCEFSADGSRIVSSGDEGQLRLWDSTSAEPIAVLLDKGANVAPWAVSPDGRLVVAGQNDGSVGIWESTTGQRLHTLKEEDERVKAVALSPDSATIATGAKDSHYETKIRLWEAATGRPLGVLSEKRCGGRGPETLMFSPDGRFLMAALAGMDSECLAVWEVNSGRRMATVPGSHRIRGFSPDGSLVLTGGSLLAVRTTSTLSEIASYWTTGARSLAWARDSSTLAVGEASGELHILHLQNAGISPPLVAGWQPQDGSPRAIRCPFCSRWSELREAPGQARHNCPNCTRPVAVADFTIRADWRLLAQGN